MRIIMYTGKGGVGKTTVSAATAVRCAQLGYRTVVLSTDLAHSLADSFDLKLGPEPIEIAPNLWAQESDITYNLDRYWNTIQKWINALFAWRGVDQLVAEELAVLPGMDELANLLWIDTHARSGLFDVIIVDCAPTGETLRLLSFPEIARWWVEKLLPVHRRVASVLRPVMRTWIGMPLPTDDVYDSVQDLFQQLDEMHAMLVDPERTTVRLVLNAEKMVIKESQRTYTYLNLFGYPADLIVCNRLLPPEVENGYFGDWKASQARYRRDIEDSFSPLPILDVPLMEKEVTGLESLEELARAIYGDADPTTVYHRGATQIVEPHDGEYWLKLPLPLTSKGDVRLLTSGDELVVHVGAHKRNVILPRVLAGLETLGARFEDDTLIVRFAKK
ncbi:MAG TPA: TRC40/GET3/ArsA family transport-energizing ATPase [Chloroflexota bacterium]|jgi:arsenite-transporting ATPase